MSNLCQPQFGNNVSRTCDTNCPVGTYGNTTYYRCEPCPTTCTSCMNLTYCTGCTTASLTANNYCFGYCADSTNRYYLQNGTCVACVLTVPIWTCWTACLAVLTAQHASDLQGIALVAAVGYIFKMGLDVFHSAIVGSSPTVVWSASTAAPAWMFWISLPIQLKSTARMWCLSHTTIMLRSMATFQILCSWFQHLLDDCSIPLQDWPRSKSTIIHSCSSFLTAPTYQTTSIKS